MRNAVRICHDVVIIKSLGMLNSIIFPVWAYSPKFETNSIFQ